MNTSRIKNTNWHYELGRWRLLRVQSPKPHECQVRFCKNPLYVRTRISPSGSVCYSEESICNRCKFRIWAANNPEKLVFKQLRSSAKERGIPFEINFPELMAIVRKTDYMSQRGITKGSLQIDRIDAHKGYHPDNIQVITKSENCSKRMFEKPNPSPHLKRPENEPF